MKLAEMRLDQMSELERKDAGTLFDVQQRQSEVDQLRAQLDAARWNLEKATVRAPADGHVTNLALRKGARVGNLPIAPVMAFIDTSETVLVAEISQNDARVIEVGQKAEVTFKYLPGRIFTGRVEAILQAVSTGQGTPSGTAVTPREIVASPFVVRLVLDDSSLAQTLPAGSTGMAAIFTEHVKASHLIRQALLRQEAIINYIWPY